ncbi:Amidohydrolase-related domain-containing protein [Plasmodiophora brassicae]|uniref:2-amino-3-carboxymuconate-6-semialdehyde decarboxylase n=1 Tax=Plasmodiophora brassicae TaxID=37360 RepID=A0A0G4IWA8_PLABS|nr:hypothetical protein PBRA_001262 [Plasmodiophora brassicae]
MTGSAPASPSGQARRRCFKVDLHTHILPRHLPNLNERYGYGDFIHMQYDSTCCKTDMYKGQHFFRRVEDTCFDSDARLRDCMDAGVDLQVLSTVPVMFSYWAKPDDALDLCQLLNNDLHQTVKARPDRYVGLGTVPLQAPDLAIAELRRCVKELGFAGVQIGTNVNGLNLGDPSLFPFFQEVANLSACVFVHPWDMAGESSMQKYWLPWLVGMPAESSRAICSMVFGGVFERIPGLRVAFAHGGGSFPGTIGRIEHAFHVRPDLCAVDTHVSPRSQLGRFWVDSLVHDPSQLQAVVDLFGEDKVALGTDYPFPLGEARPGHLIESQQHWTSERKARLLYQNALEFLGLPPTYFDTRVRHTLNPY